MPELMRKGDYSGSSNMRSSCWHGDRLDLVEITAEDWWGMEFPTTSSSSSCPGDQVSTPYDHGFEVLAKSSSSKPSLGGHGSALFSCFRHCPVRVTGPDLEPSTPPRSEVASSSRFANGNVTEFVEVDQATENSHRVYSGYESDHQLHMYSDEEPTSPMVNCIGQVRPKKKPKHIIAKRSEPGAAGNNERLVLESLAKLHSLQLASPRSGGASEALPEGAAKCKSGGKWKQMFQLAPSPPATAIRGFIPRLDV